MRINNTEAVQERACILVSFQPVWQSRIIQTPLVLPLFDGNAIDLSVPFIIVTGYMLCSEVENTTYACLLQVLHFFQGLGIGDNLTELSVTVFPFWKVGKNVSSGLVPIYYLYQVRIVVPCWIMVFVFRQRWTIVR